MNEEEVCSVISTDLPKEVGSLIPLIGFESVMKIVKKYGGGNIYFPTYHRVMRSVRNRKIKQEFNGSNYKELSRKYNVSISWVRTLVDNKK